MEQYKKAYAYLVGQIDEALTLLDTDNLLELARVREILSSALLEVEESMIKEQ